MTSIGSAYGSSSAYYTFKKDMFSKLDTDGSGGLSKQEVGRSSEGNALRPGKSASASSVAETSSITSSNPESLLSGDAMAVLMLMSQQGGMPTGSFSGAGDMEMDSDGDGAVTQTEFLAARPDEMSEEDATAIFQSIDRGGDGAVTEEEFAAKMETVALASGGPMLGQSDDATAQEAFDSADANKDGIVSSDEFLAFNPQESQESEQTSSVDVGNTASIKGQLLDELMERLRASRQSVHQNFLQSEQNAVADETAKLSSSSETAVLGA